MRVPSAQQPIEAVKLVEFLTFTEFQTTIEGRIPTLRRAGSKRYVFTISGLARKRRPAELPASR
jgi:hypothetical protein